MLFHILNLQSIFFPHSPSSLKPDWFVVNRKRWKRILRFPMKRVNENGGPPSIKGGCWWQIRWLLGSTDLMRMLPIAFIQVMDIYHVLCLRKIAQVSLCICRKWYIGRTNGVLRKRKYLIWNSLYNKNVTKFTIIPL